MYDIIHAICILEYSYYIQMWIHTCINTHFLSRERKRECLSFVTEGNEVVGGRRWEPQKISCRLRTVGSDALRSGSQALVWGGGGRRGVCVCVCVCVEGGG